MTIITLMQKCADGRILEFLYAVNLEEVYGF